MSNLTKWTFDNEIVNIFSFFRLKDDPDDQTLEMWFKKVNRLVSEESMAWISEQICELERLPRNLPNEIKKQYRLYARAHTESEKTVYGDCDECFTIGLIWFKKLNYDYNPPMKIEYVARCALCNNSEKHFGSLLCDGGISRDGITYKPVPQVTKQQLRDLGYEVVKVSDPRLPPLPMKPMSPKTKRDDEFSHIKGGLDGILR